MSEVHETVPAQLCVGDRILLEPLTQYALTKPTHKQRAAAASDPSAVTGFERAVRAIILRTSVFDVAVPFTAKVSRVVG
ncbi:hypothetical protein [Mycolicibacterium sp.]|uniref:hypothetical protein n=1 Tax=Mycolicibacterium sp. TaxID=2320850 RepID=UPI00355F86ED